MLSMWHILHAVFCAHHRVGQGGAGSKQQYRSAFEILELSIICMLQAQHKHMFQPELPTATVEAIERLGFGVVDKIYIDFGAASTTSPAAAQQHFTNYGPAGGSNADQSKAAQHSSQGYLKEHADNSMQDDSMHPLTAKDALSYYLLWHRNPEDFQPKLSADSRHEDKQAAAVNVSRDPLRDIKDMNDVNGRQQDNSARSPAAKGAGDKGPETHVITGPQTAGTDSTDAKANAEADSVASTTGRQHDLPAWAHGAYTIRFAGSEFVADKPAQILAASNRCGVMWMTGEDARRMEAASDAELQQHIAAVLQEFPALALPSEFKVYRSCWGSDPLFRGSYSYGSASAVGGECSALAEPLCAPESATLRLLFAGEACHSRYFGCTHGAYVTGQSQARALMKSLNIGEA